MSRLPSVRYIWKIFFAAVGLVDFSFTFLVTHVEFGVNNSRQDSCLASDVYQNGTNAALTSIYIVWSSGIQSWIRPVFYALCLVEAIVRAAEARTMALDNRALDDLEQAMLNVAHQSGMRLSMMFGAVRTIDDQRKELSFIDRWMKFNRTCWTWIPAVGTFAFWLFILPTETEDFFPVCDRDKKLHDSAMFTTWFITMSNSLTNISVSFQELVDMFFWTKIMPYRIHKHPQRFIQRLKVILRWIRFGRFAGPLLRMGLKLQDQLMSIWKSRQQSKQSELKKKQHIARPSLIFSDILRLKSLAEKQIALAKGPSFTQFSPAFENIASSVKETFNERRVAAKRIARQISKLQEEFFGGDGANKSAELYDRILKATFDLTNSLKVESRYLLSPRTLLSSRKYLISPRTRFSIVWRLIVTNCLMLEIFRLLASWHLSKTFSISLSQVVVKLLVECKASEKSKHMLEFIADRIRDVGSRIFDILPIFSSKTMDQSMCIPSGAHAQLIHQFGLMLEVFIDGVVFLDIFVWFFTGDIDIDSHLVTPKPFFTRCIIPGTLAQVLDHPTLPALLPGILKTIAELSYMIGYSRCLRWFLALAPAMKVVVFDPLKLFFFRHIKEDKGFIYYAESFGMLSPERKVLDDGSSSNLLVGLGGTRKLSSRFTSSTFNSSSQVGLSFDDSPVSSRQDIQSMISDDDLTSFDDDRVNINSPFTSNPLLHSILHKREEGEESSIPTTNPTRRSVHFGFLDQSVD